MPSDAGSAPAASAHAGPVPWPLPHDLGFEAVHERPGLRRLDARFLAHLTAHHPDLARRLRAARREPPADALEESELLIALAGPLEDFLAGLFGITDAVGALRAAHTALEPVLRTKYKFVKRQALLGIDEDARAAIDATDLRTRLAAAGADPADEPAFAAAVLHWQETARKGEPAERERARDQLELARRYAAWAAGTEAGRRAHPQSVLFTHPQPLDPERRVALAQSHSGADGSVEHRIDPVALRHRQGFALTDAGFSMARAVDEARYCLTCHRQDKDSCRRGLRRDASVTAGGPEIFRKSAFGEPLGGCPLEERISEFLHLKQAGRPVGALAMILLDNPMVAATGHRICNDCSKACIFQQQTPVDIPQAETRTLRDVLGLPYGVELYGLLLRWNPLDLRRWLPAPPSGRRVLVTGAGPAGFTLAHELARAGHQVVIVDGLKIEPEPRPPGPVRDFDTLAEPLDARLAGGFGGVAEYGITVRWDKNFLRLIRLLLERWPRLRLFGGVRLGSTLDLDDAWALGFDHVALALGAGRPTLLGVPGELAIGVRAASDFLMALQLTGAARTDSLANLELRLPAVVIGGGLTAIDTATEARAYYAVQVEKMLARHEALVARGDAAAASEPARSAHLREFLDHARALRAAGDPHTPEGAAARDALIEGWGGVTIAYRRRLIDSPAYRLNPEELDHALAEGVRVLADVQPVAIETDADHRVRGVRLRDGGGRTFDLPARTVLVAAGTQPNTMIVEETGGALGRQGRFLATHGGGSPGAGPKDPGADFICHETGDGRTVSMLGDAHPAFAGSVVRAMASARRAAPVIDARLRARRAAGAPASWPRFVRRLTDAWTARVVRVTELSPGIVELVVRAPAAARRFAPGQFFRLQNFETLAPRIETGGLPTRLATETLAMTGAWVDRRAGEVALVVLEMGGTADLVRGFRPGEPVILMGPTGEPTTIVPGETVVLVGGGLGNAVLFSIGAAMRAAGCRVLYVAGYRRPADRFHAARIEAAADSVVWCCEGDPGFEPARAGDAAISGTVVDALRALSRGELPRVGVRLETADRLVAIGSDRMMAAVAEAVRGPLKNSLKEGISLVASINSPMQCMMKAICAQCLQRQVDPATGQERVVFSCAAQDQPLLAVDFTCLSDRLAQNATQERLAARWQAAVVHQVGAASPPVGESAAIGDQSAR